MGKQSSFPRQVAYDVLCTFSSASQRNSVLASRLREAQFIIGILADALLSLLPPVPILPAPPLPPRPDVMMDRPTSQEGLDPAPNSTGPLILPAPPLPPRPDVVMDPPATQENPEPTPDSLRPLWPSDPLPHRATPVEPLLGLAPSRRPPKARTPPRATLARPHGVPSLQVEFPQHDVPLPHGRPPDPGSTAAGCTAAPIYPAP